MPSDNSATNCTHCFLTDIYYDANILDGSSLKSPPKWKSPGQLQNAMRIAVVFLLSGKRSLSSPCFVINVKNKK